MHAVLRSHGLILLGLAGCALMLLLKGWVAEDAYITFRVLDNAVHGYGLRWNIHDRVQVFTHPLWFLLLLPLYALLGHIFLVSIAAGIACSVLALWVAVRAVVASPIIHLAFFLLPVMLSRTLMEYGTSGLESSLQFLLIALLYREANRPADAPYYLRRVFFICALLMFNRLDSVLLCGPLMLYLLVQHRGSHAWKEMLVGMLPLFAWLAFSLFYYGFLLPNTAYAKLGNGLPMAMQLENGRAYFELFFTYDFPGAVWVYGVLPLLILLALQDMPQNRFQHFQFLFATGAVIYLVFAYLAGGDYMAGRFMASPLFITHLLFLAYVAQRRSYLVPALFLVALYGWHARDYAACPTCYEIDPGIIIDARATFDRNQLVLSTFPPKLRTEGQHGFAAEGRALADMPEPRIKVQNFNGMAGYYAGPTVTLVDQHGLSDILLARLPAQEQNRFYAGHFYRELPPGYLYAIHTGSTEQMNDTLALYYEALRTITQEPPFSTHRLTTLVRFHLGHFDSLKEDYVARLKR